MTTFYYSDELLLLHIQIVSCQALWWGCPTKVLYRIAYTLLKREYFLLLSRLLLTQSMIRLRFMFMYLTEYSHQPVNNACAVPTRVAVGRVLSGPIGESEERERETSHSPFTLSFLIISCVSIHHTGVLQRTRGHNRTALKPPRRCRNVKSSCFWLFLFANRC